MLKVTAFKERTSKDGKKFVTIDLQGGLELVQSSISGKFYACVRKTSVVSTFSSEVARMLIGSEIPGRIQRIECDPYEYTIQETGEIVSLSYTWGYVPETSIPQLEQTF
jgi:hypothetical protein